MNRLFVVENYKKICFGECSVLTLGLLLMCSSLGLWAQTTTSPASATYSIRATHLLGFPGTKNNCNGTLSIKDDEFRFEPDSKPATEVKIASVQGVFLGSESKQVGGTPTKLGKAAAPFGSGRVVSLFAHKKYDTLTVEYVDADGGVHGAIFQMAEGRASQVRQELMARGVRPGVRDERLEPSTAETSYENQ